MERSRVQLPSGVREPFRVFRNGVPQEEGRHFVRRGGVLEFPDRLAKDRISKKRWFLGAWGVGTYRQDDSIDIAWTGRDGSPRIAHRVDVEVVGD